MTVLDCNRHFQVSLFTSCSRSCSMLVTCVNYRVRARADSQFVQTCLDAVRAHASDIRSVESVDTTVDVNVSHASEAYSASFVTLAHKSSRSPSLTQKHVNADGEFLVSLLNHLILSYQIGGDRNHLCVCSSHVVSAKINSTSPEMQAHSPVTRTVKEGTSSAVVEGKEITIVQQPDMYPARKGTWTSVGLVFVNDGIKYWATTRKVFDENGSWNQKLCHTLTWTSGR